MNFADVTKPEEGYTEIPRTKPKEGYTEIPRIGLDVKKVKRQRWRVQY